MKEIHGTHWSVQVLFHSYPLSNQNQLEIVLLVAEKEAPLRCAPEIYNGITQRNQFITILAGHCCNRMSSSSFEFKVTMSVFHWLVIRGLEPAILLLFVGPWINRMNTLNILDCCKQLSIISHNLLATPMACQLCSPLLNWVHFCKGGNRALDMESIILSHNSIPFFYRYDALSNMKSFWDPWLNRIQTLRL